MEFCDPFRVVFDPFAHRGSSLALRPPATFWQPSGLLARSSICRVVLRIARGIMAGEMMKIE
jgi:hypothetical protein